MTTRAELYETYKGEHVYIDGTEEVTYTAEGDVEAEAVVGKRLDWSQIAATFNPADFNDADQPWVIWADTLGGVELQAGGVLEDSSGTKFIIRSFTKQRHATQYHCVCSRIANYAGE